ncbi:Predicted exporter of the RND superfamily [hydrothermal vent metagenome]|uniref:Predicted exporter of the RND superfamily n=1 Tax=hydrothermal vent metagenome TaxID=652676 RepID=A0A3B1EA90_9ZZZZ
MNWKNKVEKKFENFSDFVFDNRIKVILAVLFIVVAMASQMKNLTADTSTEGFLHENDEMRLQYDAFKKQFGNDDRILVAIKTKDVFNINFLNKLSKLHKDIENNVPYIDDVNSLINARNTRGTADSLIVDDLFEDLPTSAKQLALKKELVKSNPLLENLIIDKKGTITTIIIDTNTYTSLNKNGEDIVADANDDDFSEETLKKEDIKKEFLSDIESVKAIEKVKEIVKKYESEDFKILISGSAVVASELKAAMKYDMQKFIKLVLLTMAVFLAIMFRRVSGVILPLVTVIITIITTLSLMAIFQAPITVVTQILPSFLLAVMIGASIHLLSIFYNKYDEIKNKKDALRYAMGHSGFAIVMTSLTTAAGLWSFSFSLIAPIANLGKFASMGIILGLLYTVVLLPAMLALLKIKAKDRKSQDKNHTSVIDKILIKVSHISVSYPKIIITISIIIIFVSISLASQLRFSHNPIKWFEKDNQIRVATAMFDTNLNGSSSFEIIIDTKKENGLYGPEILNKIDKFTNELLQMKTNKYYIGKTTSIVDIIKETNKALHENNQSAYNIPTDRNLIAQELLLFENSGSDDLEDFVDSRFAKAKITVKVPFLDAIDYIELLKDLKVVIKNNFDEKVEVSITGISHLLARIISGAMSSSAVSYILAIVLITIMMLILIGNIKIGLISMIPNISPILIMTTVMVIFDMPLDMFTMLIGAIAIGLAVDDTVHFMHNFRRYEQQYNNVNKAVEMTLLTSGKAMIVTTIVLTFGFFVFMGASMSNIFNFGLLTGIAIMVALLADFFLVPALMKVMVKDKKSFL